MSQNEYEIIAMGELSANGARAFAGMTLRRSEGQVVLSGAVRDKDDLEALLMRVHDLGLRLLSVRSPAWRVGVTGAGTQ
jgi:hypothetical protein